MFKNVSLRMKLFSSVTVVVIVSFLIVTWMVSVRSIEVAKEDAFLLADEMAEKTKNEITAELQGARVTSETLKAVFETLKGHGVTDREIMNDLLRHTLEQKEYITAFCVAYDPDMLDGLDAEYAGQSPMYDETGRYAPYWNKVGDSISAEYLKDIDDQDWYFIPKATGKEYITDPYPFQVRGQDVMLASFVFPVMHEGEFIGFIASDIVLDKLQEMVADVNTSGRGEFTEIYSNSGAVVAHPSKHYLGKTLDETLAYDMMVLHPETIAAALPLAEEYLDAIEPFCMDDEAQAQEYAGMTAFIDDLQAYAADQSKPKPDIALMTPGLAEAMLKGFDERRAYAEQATAAIRDGETYVANDEDFYTVYVPVQFSADTKPWSVAVSVPLSEVLETANDIRSYVIFVCLVALLLISTVLYLVASSITKPIKKLTDVAVELGGGNFDVDLPQAGSSKEIGVLTEAVESMIGRIEDLVGKLQSHSKELEEKNVRLNNLNGLMKAANHVAETVLNVDHQQFDDVLYRSLSILGTGIGARSISIWENYTKADGKAYSRELSSWEMGSDSWHSAGRTVAMDEFHAVWARTEKTEAGDGGFRVEAQSPLHRFSGSREKDTIYLIPLVMHGTYWGSMTLSFDGEPSKLCEDACEILRSGGMMVAAAIIQNQITGDLEEAEEMASTDALTGLANRNGFLAKAPAVYAASRLDHTPMTLFFFDLDHFKEVNDDFGHPFGDEVLKAFTSIVRLEEGDSGVSCRYGGEEFVLLKGDCTASEGRAVAERVLDAVRNARFEEHPEFRATVSIGMVSAIPTAHDTLNGYIQKADSALYRAKRTGRDRVVIYEEAASEAGGSQG